MLKEFLAGLSPSLREVLPHGSIDELAEKCGKTRQSITPMIKGALGDEENVRVVVEEAIKILLEDIEVKQQMIERLERELKKREGGSATVKNWRLVPEPVGA